MEKFIDIFKRVIFKFLITQKPVAGAVPFCAGVDLPASPRVFRFRVRNRDIGIAFCAVGLRLPEQQKILRAPDAHLCAVLAVFAPSEAVGLVVLAHNVSLNRDPPEKQKTMFAEMRYRFIAERVNDRRTGMLHGAEQNPVFDVDCGDTAGLQNPEQFRCQKVHLLKELFIVQIVPEVIVIRRVFIMV